jgi:hypothetical protein
MARIRTIKPEFWGSAKAAKVSRDARLLFLGLLNEADDEGRALASARSIGGSLFPHDEDFSDGDVRRCLDELEAARFVQTYEVDGVKYLHVVGFTEHQKISHPSPSRLPAPPCGGPPEPLRNGSGAAPESLPPDLGSGKGTGNREQEQGMSDAVGADVTRLCDRLADAIEANGSKRPTVGKTWHEACDRMLRLDGRTPEQVERAIDWCQADEFWRANVLSMPKLREKFDQLRLQAKRSTGPPRDQDRSNVGRNFAVLRQLAEMDERAAG